MATDLVAADATMAMTAVTSSCYLFFLTASAAAKTNAATKNENSLQKKSQSMATYFATFFIGRLITAPTIFAKKIIRFIS